MLFVFPELITSVFAPGHVQVHRNGSVPGLMSNSMVLGSEKGDGTYSSWNCMVCKELRWYRISGQSMFLLLSNRLFLRLLLNSLAVGAEMTPPRDAEIQWGYLFSAYQVQMENNYANAGGLNLFGCELCSVHEGKSA